MNFLHKQRHYIDENSKPHTGGKRVLIWLTPVILLTLVIVGFIFRDKLFKNNSVVFDSKLPTTKESGYNAVFLANGQVYFGKLSGLDRSFIELQDVFYLQIDQQGQALQGLQQNSVRNQANSQSKLQLIKLGNELHGPTDVMKINKDQVIFYEDIRKDSKVYQAIEQYKKDNL